MNAQPEEKNRMTPEEYLELERSSIDVKHEYYDGEIFAMTGASFNHNRIAGNISGELREKFKNSSCEAFSNDVRVKIETIDKYTYPDVVIACGDIERENINGVETLINPLVIIEVLSKSTEAYDRGKKFKHYRLIPSLREYILISQNDYDVERFSRNESGIWQILNSCTDVEQVIKIESVDCQIEMSEIYRWVEFESDDTDTPS